MQHNLAEIRLRAVSTALDDGLGRLSLDCVQDHALPLDIYRQMALDAYEGEQHLNHTASNREHVWRILQGSELIAPVPPGQPSLVSTEADVVSAPTKPKRTRRVREPKAKRYPVGEPEAEQGA